MRVLRKWHQLPRLAFTKLICAQVWGCIYETKGLSLEQVDELYAKVDHAWQSKGFVPTVSFAEVQDLAHPDSRRATLADLEAGVERKRSVAHADNADVTTGEKY